MNLHFSVNPTTFAQQLKKVMPASGRSTLMEILSHVLVEIKDGAFRLTCSDLDTALRSAGTATNHGDEGALTVSARKLHDIVRTISADQGDLVFKLRNEMIEVSVRRSRFKLRTLPAEDFPALPEIASAATISAPAETLRALLGKCRYAMANGDVRQMLNGMLVDAEGTNIVCVASDGHRMAVAKGELKEAGSNPVKAILPRKAVEILSSMLDGADGDVKLEVAQRHFRLVLADCGLVSSLIEGEFPDYKKAVPQCLEHTIKMDRATLLDAVTRVGIVASDKTNAVVLAGAEGLLKVSATTAEQHDGMEETGATCPGFEGKIGVNGRYLTDALRAIQSDDIAVQVRDYSTAIIVTPVVHDGSGHVIMPLRL